MMAVFTTLLLLAAVALSTVALAEAHSAVEQYDAAVGSQVLIRGEAIQGAPTASRATPQSVDNRNSSEPSQAIQEPRLHCTLTLLSDHTAKDLFDSTISKAYSVIEVSLGNNSSTGFVVSGLELHPADGEAIQPTPARFIARQLSHNRKLMPAGLISEAVLVPTTAGVRTWLFVEKHRLKLVNGQLPARLQLFGSVSETLFVMKNIP